MGKGQWLSELSPNSFHLLLSQLFKSLRLVNHSLQMTVGGWYPRHSTAFVTAAFITFFNNYAVFEYTKPCDQLINITEPEVLDKVTGLFSVIGQGCLERA